ncbi:hypothetical protein CIHG_00888 [Coccidioides immitis H538.4]|uniref:Uncharacterized protein n=2 Tax=Coccidioides immitis TaxID=5501 RepID=A0A0J8REU8_COCIT|nr:hypothetical protein CIRG_03305 [Coccidioides immitis RMSCC 2394]KMU83106.1 hypothetical protein CIHG_00888 [Coccidioides immitis H538.4]
MSQEYPVLSISRIFPPVSLRHVHFDVLCGRPALDRVLGSAGRSIVRAVRVGRSKEGANERSPPSAEVDINEERYSDDKTLSKYFLFPKLPVEGREGVFYFAQCRMMGVEAG